MPVEPAMTSFYYLADGIRADLVAQTRPFPRGLRVMAGNAMASGVDDPTSAAHWSCMNAPQVPASRDFVNCPPGSMLES